MLIFKLFLERFASSRVSSPLLCLLFPMRMMSMMILMSISNQSMPRSASHLTHYPGLVLFVSFIIVLLFPRNLKKPRLDKSTDQLTDEFCQNWFQLRLTVYSASSTFKGFDVTNRFIEWFIKDYHDERNPFAYAFLSPVVGKTHCDLGILAYKRNKLSKKWLFFIGLWSRGCWR